MLCVLVGELRWLKTTVTYKIPIYFLLVTRSYGGGVQFIEYSNNRPSYFPWQSRTNDRQTRRLSSLLSEIKLIWRGKKCHERCLRTSGTGTGWLAAGAALNNSLWSWVNSLAFLLASFWHLPPVKCQAVVGSVLAGYVELVRNVCSRVSFAWIAKYL